MMGSGDGASGSSAADAGGNPLADAKNEMLESLTLAHDQMRVEATCTLTHGQVSRLMAAQKSLKNGLGGGDPGEVFLFRDLIDDFEMVEETLLRFMHFNFATEQHQQMSFNFMLLGATLSEVSVASSNGLALGATLALPAVRGMHYPTDELTADGAFRRIFDLRRAVRFGAGARHSAVHLFHSGGGCGGGGTGEGGGSGVAFPSTSASAYELLAADSVINQPLIFPDGALVGNGGDSTRLDRSKFMSHGFRVNNATVYHDDAHPALTETLSHESGVEVNRLVAVPSKCYPNTWFRRPDEAGRGANRVVSVDEYVHGVYRFVDSINTSRCANLHNAGLYVSFKGRDESKPTRIKFKIALDVVPVVPYMERGAEFVPYYNYRTAVEGSLPKATREEMWAKTASGVWRDCADKAKKAKAARAAAATARK